MCICWHGSCSELVCVGVSCVLQESHAEMGPRLFLAPDDSENRPACCKAFNHAVTIDGVLGHMNAATMTDRMGHSLIGEFKGQIQLPSERLVGACGRRED